MPFQRKKAFEVSAVAGMLLLSFLVSVVPAHASDQSLAASLAPELRFTKGEKFFPTSVDYIIGTSTLMLRTGGEPTLVNPSPSPSNLGTADPSSFLNNKQTTVDTIAADYAASGQPQGYFAYVHVVHQGTGVVIQYWLFYIFNNGPLNDHQGDIEVIQVFADSSGNPQTLLLSQHFSGENAQWSDVETSGTHPVVYVAQGSHANYYRAYQGKIGIENDVVGADGLVITPDKLSLVMLGEPGSHSPDQSWLDFQGRWGFWGSDLEVAQGKAGPLGPVYNQDGIRWASPQEYLSQTLPVSSLYFNLGLVGANFLLIFVAYAGLRGAWKVFSIVRLSRKGRLASGRLWRGRLGAGAAVIAVGIVITIVALFLPWYTITSSSETGPLGALGKVPLLHLDGISGLTVNFFNGANSDSSSGFSTLLSTQIPFSTILAAGVVLLILDLIGFSSGGKLGRKLMFGAVGSLIPFILIFVFISQITLLLPWASQLLPGEAIPEGVYTLVQTVGSNPIGGAASQTFPVVGSTTVEWGFGLGAYLFILAAIIRIVAAVIIWGAKAEPPVQPPAGPQFPTPPPPPPPPQQ